MGLLNWMMNGNSRDELRDFVIRPGPWFKKYINDFMEAFDVDEQQMVTSGIVTGEESGEYIWVTATPEWDVLWFKEHGYRFPRRWVPYKCMDLVVGEDGGPAMLPGL